MGRGRGCVALGCLRNAPKMPGRDTGAMMGRRWTLLWTGSKPVARARLRVAVSVLGPVSSLRDRSWAREAVFGLGGRYFRHGPKLGHAWVASRSFQRLFTSHTKNKKLLLR